jgi:hypothetical protein
VALSAVENLTTKVNELNDSTSCFCWPEFSSRRDVL